MAGGKLEKLRMNSAGAIELLQSQAVQTDLHARGERVHAALPTDKGEEWEVETKLGHDRAAAIVRPVNDAARRRNAEEMSLIRALDRGR